MTSKNRKGLLWLGALGGAVGGILWVLIVPELRGEPLTGYGGYFLFLALIVFTPIATIVGVMIAGVIWWLHVKFKLGVGLESRAIVGALFAMVLGETVSLLGVLSHPSASKSAWRISDVLYFAAFGIVVGAVARPRERSDLRSSW